MLVLRSFSLWRHCQWHVAVLGEKVHSVALLPPFGNPASTSYSPRLGAACSGKQNSFCQGYPSALTDFILHLGINKTLIS